LSLVCRFLVSDTPSPEEDLTLLKQSAEEAAELVMGFYKKDPSSWTKNGSSPVSEADLASDALLKERLLGARPDYGWLSEETEDNIERLSRDSVWVVDPIDGTNAFLQGRPDFTVCAGLVRDGEAIAGVVINPVHGQTFAAIRGIGAWLNDGRLSKPNEAALQSARYLCRRNVMKPERWKGDIPAPKSGYIGSLAYQLCLIASGKWDAAISVSPLHEWDIAAAGLILMESGGIVTDQRGGSLRYNRDMPRIDGMICAAPMLHEAIRDDFIPKQEAGIV